MTRLFLVRHGPTHAKAMTGWRDIPADLSDTAALRRMNALLPIPALVASSDLMRASDTANALSAGRTRLPPNPAFREINFGAWDGLHWSEVAARDPDLSRAFWEDPGDHRAPDGESWNEAAARSVTALDALCHSHPGRDLILVTHMGIILAQLQHRLAISATSALSHRIDPLSVTILSRYGHDWQADAINHCP
jgi:broad specificity phosphatase PhoE